MSSALLSMSPTLSRAASGPMNADTARQVAEEFESVFLSSMMEHMFAGLETDGPFGGGQAESTYRSMLVEEYGKSVAATGGIGIADDIARDLLALQEMPPDDHPDAG